jgi:hypothetical protein
MSKDTQTQNILKFKIHHFPVSTFSLEIPLKNSPIFTKNYPAVCVAVLAFQKATVTVTDTNLTVQTHAEVQLKRMHVEFAMEMGVLVVMTPSPTDPTTPLLHLPPISALSDLTKGTTSKCHAEIRRSSQSLMSLFLLLGSLGQ